MVVTKGRGIWRRLPCQEWGDFFFQDELLYWKLNSVPPTNRILHLCTWPFYYPCILNLDSALLYRTVIVTFRCTVILYTVPLLVYCTYNYTLIPYLGVQGSGHRCISGHRFHSQDQHGQRHAGMVYPCGEVLFLSFRCFELRVSACFDYLSYDAKPTSACFFFFFSGIEAVSATYGVFIQVSLNVYFCTVLVLSWIWSVAIADTASDLSCLFLCLVTCLSFLALDA